MRSPNADVEHEIFQRPQKYFGKILSLRAWMKSHCAMYVWVIQAHLCSKFSKPKLLTSIALPVTNIRNAVQNIWQNKTTKCFCSRFMDSVVKSVFRFLGLAKLEYERGHEIFALRIFSHSSSYCVVAWLFCR